MAEVYDTQPKLHRSNVTTVDAAEPASVASGIDSQGYKECRFDITLTGTDITNLEVQVLFWNTRQEKWFAGGKRTFDAAGNYALTVEARSAVIFLKITAFTGTDFSLSADQTLS